MPPKFFAALVMMGLVALTTPACKNSDKRPAADAGADCTADPSSCEYLGQQLEVAGREAGSITDPQTGRVLPLYVRYPMGPGPYPVVIWSHGGGYNNNGHHHSQIWGDTIAGAGYIVLHLAHVEVADAAVAEGLCTVAAVPVDECMGTATPLNGDGAFLTIARPRDVIALLDQLPELAAAFTAAGGPAVDTSRVAIAGWSGGSRAPMALFGTRRYLTASLPQFQLPDARPLAAVALSPAGPGFFGFYDGEGGTSWDETRGPMLVITGENDVKLDPADLIGSIRRQAYDLQPSDGSRRLLYSHLPEGVGSHGTYNLDELTSLDSRVVNLSLAIRSSVLAFLDAKLRDDADAQEWLDSDRALRLAGDAEWSTR